MKLSINIFKSLQESYAFREKCHQVETQTCVTCIFVGYFKGNDFFRYSKGNVHIGYPNLCASAFSGTTTKPAYELNTVQSEIMSSCRFPRKCSQKLAVQVEITPRATTKSCMFVLCILSELISCSYIQQNLHVNLIFQVKLLRGYPQIPQWFGYFR